MADFYEMRRIFLRFILKPTKVLVNYLDSHLSDTSLGGAMLLAVLLFANGAIALPLLAAFYTVVGIPYFIATRLAAACKRSNSKASDSDNASELDFDKPAPAMPGFFTGCAQNFGTTIDSLWQRAPSMTFCFKRHPVKGDTAPVDLEPMLEEDIDKPESESRTYTI